MRYLVALALGLLGGYVTLLNLSADFGPGRWPLAVLTCVLVALAVISQGRFSRRSHGCSGCSGGCACKGGATKSGASPAPNAPTSSPKGDDSCSATSHGDRQRGVVKWYNPTKGFGFIQPDDGSKDVFLHASAVERAQRATLNEGQVVWFKIVTTRGRTTADNLQFEDDRPGWPTCGCPGSSPANPPAETPAPPPASPPPPAPPPPTNSSSARERGVVRWFNPTKGFGFIQPSNGSKDIFVHIAAVERAGLNGLSEGQVIWFRRVIERGHASAVDLSLA